MSSDDVVSPPVVKSERENDSETAKVENDSHKFEKSTKTEKFEMEKMERSERSDKKASKLSTATIRRFLFLILFTLINFYIHISYNYTDSKKSWLTLRKILLVIVLQD
jgi:hypothetical protein